ncbi:MAG: hypothetical protein FJ288_20095, partial [Planctomycetes bacterium]|nr:hypothetical protein [Planctomycetota bacterium]
MNYALLSCLVLSCLVALSCSAQAQERHAPRQPAGLVDHGIALPAAEGRGYYALRTADGRNLAIGTPWDLLSPREAYILVTDLDSRVTTQVYAPTGVRGAVRHSVVASNGKFYTAVNATLLELDPTTLTWTFRGDPPPGVATYLTMAEGPGGMIWAGAVYTHLVSFDPQTRQFKYHGRMDDQEAYLSHLAFDRMGWVYCGIGVARWDIVAYHPASGEKRRLVPDAQRRPGTCRVQNGADGHVYGCTTEDNWWRLEGGQATPVAADAVPKSTSFSPEQRRLPDGRTVAGYYMLHRYLKVNRPNGDPQWIPFDYESGGADIAVLAAGPDGRIYGSGAHPSHLFRYDPQTDDLSYFPDERIAYKSLAIQGARIFGGTYAGGYLWVLDTSRPCDLKPYPSRRTPGAPPGDPPSERPKSENPNPWLVGQYDPNVNIPRAAFAHPDGQHILIAGQPGYGYVGGGMIIHNLETKQTLELTHEDLIPNHSTMAMQALPSGDLLCATTPKGGHGTNPLDNSAAFYVLDWQT